MSETVTIGGTFSALIYGTHNDAIEYVQTMFGGAYTAWLALTADNQKRTLVAAARYLDRQLWIEEVEEFDDRDDVDAFQFASYELAAMLAEDAGAIAALESGSNIQSVGAGGAQVTYFKPTTTDAGTTAALPPILLALLGDYLGGVLPTVLASGSGLNSCDENPFADISDLDRRGPY